MSRAICPQMSVANEKMQEEVRATIDLPAPLQYSAAPALTNQVVSGFANPEEAPDALSSYSVKNAVLNRMTLEEFDLLRPRLELLTLSQGALIQQIDASQEFIYFVESGLVSLLVRNHTDSPVEVASIQSWGLVGIEFLVDAKKAIYRASVTSPTATVLRIKLSDLNDLVDDASALRRQFVQYFLFFMKCNSQHVLCHARHTIEQRMATWLALASEEFDGDVLRVKQEDLATALGLKRPSVSWALKYLEQEGVVKRRRSAIKVHEHSELAKRACCCLSLVRRLRSEFIASGAPSARTLGAHSLEFGPK